MINLESKYWDCEYNLNELIVFNNRKCLLNPNYEKHKSDNCFGRFSLLFKSPSRYRDNTYLEIAIREDGFVYVSDILVRNFNDFKEVDTHFAISFMLKYKNMVNAIKDFEYDLGKTVKNNEYINLLYEDNYHKENSQNIDFKIKN